MDCQKVRTTILESFEELVPPQRVSEIDSHLVGCDDCARFSAVQRSLDGRLSVLFRSPHMSPEFRPRLRQAIRRDTRQVWSPALPDVVHFLACGTATVMCTVLLPFQASLTLGVGAAATCLTHLLATAVRDMFERADESI
jgi:anti-sigma factor RsiW